MEFKMNYRNLNYKLSLSYIDLLNIKACISYSKNRLNEEKNKQKKMKEELIVLYNKIQNQMLDKINKEKKKWNLNQLRN